MTTINNAKCLIGAQVNVQNQDDNFQFTIPVSNLQAEISEDEFNMPRLIDTFHGRGEEFDTLDELFFSDKKSKIVVHGLAGYGKTELCKQYAHKCLHKKKVGRIFWIKAENEDELKKLSIALKKIYKKYEDVPCMFVFDNAFNRQSISEYEPSNKHKMLITSHVAELGYGVVPLQIEPLSPEPAKKIFKTILEDSYIEEDSALYDELAQFVDYVPLGIQIIGGFVRQRIKSLGNSFHLKKCVEEIKQSKEDIIKNPLSKDIPNSYKNSIYGALTVSLNKIHEEEKQNKELAIIVLYVCAFLYPEEIWIDELSEIPTIRELIGNANCDTKLKSAVGLLVNFSFVNYTNSDEDTIKIHRLVQLFLRQHLCSSSLEDEKCYSAAVFSLICFYPVIATRSVLSVADASIVQECVRFLKKVFQSLNGNCKNIIYEYDLFYYTVKWNNLEILELLLQHANINETNDNEYKVLSRVAKTWNAKAVKWLINHDVYVNHRNAVNRTLVHLLSTTNNDIYLHNIVSTLAVLLEHDASFNNYMDMDIYKKKQFWLLSAAARMNNLELLRALLNKGFDGNSSWSSETVLHLAVAWGNVESLKLLINYGANANALNYWNETPSFQIVKYRNTDKQKLRDILDLLNFNHHVGSTNLSHESLLHLAAEAAHEALVSVLVETYKSDVNQQGGAGFTPLHSLIKGLKADSNKEEVVGIVRTLIQYGASLTIQSIQRETPLKYLKRRNITFGYIFEYLVPLLTPTTGTKHRCCAVL